MLLRLLRLLVQCVALDGDGPLPLVDLAATATAVKRLRGQ
jgi:hypothetical protein